MFTDTFVMIYLNRLKVKEKFMQQLKQLLIDSSLLLQKGHYLEEGVNIMSNHEILEELKLVAAGKTLDALLPPILFVLLNGFLSIAWAAAASVSLAAALFLFRIYRGQRFGYAAGGLAAVLAAAGFALLTRSAAGYFIPAISGSAFFAMIALLSLVSGRPLAAWASHLTRGWPLDWFWRKDVKPAYFEVTILWLCYFLLRLSAQVFFYRANEAAVLAWANILLGWPLLTAVLVLSYLYGMKRLKHLSGPGVDEYQAGQEPPYKGQTRGF